MSVRKVRFRVSVIDERKPTGDGLNPLWSGQHRKLFSPVDGKPGVIGRRYRQGRPENIVDRSTACAG